MEISPEQKSAASNFIFSWIKVAVLSVTAFILFTISILRQFDYNSLFGISLSLMTYLIVRKVFIPDMLDKKDIYLNLIKDRNNE